MVVPDRDMHIGARKCLIGFYTMIAGLAGGYVLIVKYSHPYKGIFTESFISYCSIDFLPHSPTCKLPDDDSGSRGPTWSRLFFVFSKVNPAIPAHSAIYSGV